MSIEWFCILYEEKALIKKVFIRKAVAVFGQGKIRSSLVVGLEDKEDTLAGVRELVDCGCIPVLSAFVPAQSTFMEQYPAPETEFLLEVVHEAAAVAHRNQMALGAIFAGENTLVLV